VQQKNEYKDNGEDQGGIITGPILPTTVVRSVILQNSPSWPPARKLYAGSKADEQRQAFSGRLSLVAQFEFSKRGVVPSEAAFQAERGISLKTLPQEIPPAAEMRRGSG
jgi:hypothetical protein